MGCEIIVNVFFHMLLNIKLYHWKTYIYARHKATDELHEKLSELTDKFIEVYMGKYSRPEYNESFNITVNNLTDTNVFSAFKEYISFLTIDILKYLDENDTDLLNIRDEILETFNQTLYLFTLQ